MNNELKVFVLHRTDCNKEVTQTSDEAVLLTSEIGMYVLSICIFKVLSQLNVQKSVD